MIIGGLLCALVVVAAIGADWLTPLDPVRMRMRDALAAPSGAHWFGTDNLGRDVASRVTHGARISLAIGLATMLVTGFAGTAIGLLAGYARGLDGPLMRIMDALMAFPPIMLAVGITAAIGPSSTNVVMALAAVYIPRSSRVVRASVLATAALDFVEAARAMGAAGGRVMLRHVLPNCLGPLIVQLSFVFAFAVLSEAALSFLGMGTPPPTPTLGSVIADGRDYIREAPWICFFPGMTLLVVVLGLNLVGDALRDVLDPRSGASAY
jgi:peptide/nickel transport system permease protein